MNRTILYFPEEGTVQTGGDELVAVWKSHPNSIIWLDMEGGEVEGVKAQLRAFDIHPLAIQDAIRPRHPPKIESFDSALFILLRGLDAETDGIDSGTIQLSLFVGERFLLTRHSKRSVSADWLFKTLHSNSHLMAKGPGSLALSLSNRLARRYVEILLELEPRLDEIEEEMFERPEDRLLNELTRYKSRLRKLTRIANYHHVIADTLRSHEHSHFDVSLTHEIADLYEQIERAQSLSSLYYQICCDLSDGYLGLSSHRLNRVMQVLTIITVIFVPLTFLAGIYGMNFQNMPELASSNGYFIVIGIMVVVAIIQLFFFRRKGWV